MIKTISTMAALACLAMAQQTPQQSSAQGTPKETITIPEGAVKDGDHYRYVDKDGKAWIYRKTPFGIKKKAEGATPASSEKTIFPAPRKQANAADRQAAAEPDHAHLIKAVREGDTIHFSKPSPFGTTKWDRKIGELTPEEQKIWDREQAKGSQ